mmetsp:Transcript_13326/g.23455  ORF Transcript_13326/g.23455 Transcript_13326/m.23455 type:complete len:234 (+) Transcript_13326:1529-2230(+)
MNGASANLARRLAISVLPHPVGPIIRMFFGVMSCCMDAGTRCLRHLFLKATATAFLASSWPIMCLLRRSTTAAGVSLASASLSYSRRGRERAGSLLVGRNRLTGGALMPLLLDLVGELVPSAVLLLLPELGVPLPELTVLSPVVLWLHAESVLKLRHRFDTDVSCVFMLGSSMRPGHRVDACVVWFRLGSLDGLDPAVASELTWRPAVRAGRGPETRAPPANSATLCAGLPIL